MNVRRRPSRTASAVDRLSNSTGGLPRPSPQRRQEHPTLLMDRSTIAASAHPPSAVLPHSTLTGLGELELSPSSMASLFPGPPFLPALDELNAQIASYPGLSHQQNAPGATAGSYESEGAAVSDPDNSSDVLTFLERWQWLAAHWSLGLPRLGPLEPLKQKRQHSTRTQRSARNIGHLDWQGINWAGVQTDRSEARRVRSTLCVGGGRHDCRSEVSVFALHGLCCLAGKAIWVARRAATSQPGSA